MKVVRLVMNIDEEDPGDAVEAFVEAIISQGLRGWVYRVEELDDPDDFSFHDGYGLDVDIESLLASARADAESEETSNEDEAPSAKARKSRKKVVDTPLPDGASDDELLELARDLNSPA